MITADVSRLVSPVVAKHGLEIDRLEVAPAGRRSVVRIFLDGDGPAGLGPSLDQIAEATRAISSAFDASDVSKGRPYTLEVSSRGVGRPLTEAKHYRRNRGRLVEVVVAEETITGRIVSVADQSVELDVAGSKQSIPLDAISKALVQVELNRPVAEDNDEEEEC